jgi:hypothetical protein
LALFEAADASWICHCLRNLFSSPNYQEMSLMYTGSADFRTVARHKGRRPSMARGMVRRRISFQRSRPLISISPLAVLPPVTARP